MRNISLNNYCVAGQETKTRVALEFSIPLTQVVKGPTDGRDVWRYTIGDLYWLGTYGTGKVFRGTGDDATGGYTEQVQV